MQRKTVIVVTLCVLLAGVAEGKRQRLPLSRLPAVQLEFSRISETKRPNADDAIRRELAARLEEAGVRITDDALQALKFRITETPVPGCPEVVHLLLEVWLFEPVTIPRFPGIEYNAATMSARADAFFAASDVESESRDRLLSFASYYVLTEVAAQREREAGSEGSAVPGAPEDRK